MPLSVKLGLCHIAQEDQMLFLGTAVANAFRRVVDRRLHEW